MARHVTDPGWRIAAFQRATGASEADAQGYLEAEEWDLQEALISYRGDQRAVQPRAAGACLTCGAAKSRLECAGACAFAGAIAA